VSDASSCPSRCATPWAWPGSTVDISLYGAGLTVVPGGRTARLVEEDGHLVADVDVENGQEVPVLTDEDLFRLIDAVRR